MSRLRFFSSPRIWFSRSSLILTRSARFSKSARSAWLSRLLTRTSLNEPHYMISAMPKASLRSLLLIFQSCLRMPGSQDGQAPTYTMVGGADATLFTIDSATGALAFITAPDFENPMDADQNNTYEVTVEASDGVGGIDTQAIAVSVANVAGNSVIQAPTDVSNTLGLFDTDPHITLLSGGGYALTWNTRGSDLTWDVFTAVYDAQGQRI